MYKGWATKTSPCTVTFEDPLYLYYSLRHQQRETFSSRRVYFTENILELIVVQFNKCANQKNPSANTAVGDMKCFIGILLPSV
jgi:hypothetical protein